MTVVVDTGPLVAVADRRNPQARSIEESLRTYPGPLVIPAPVTAEVDYLLGKQLGPSARRSFLSDLANGRFEVACLDQADHQRALEVDARYADLNLGLCDAAVVVVAARYRTENLFTFDHRCFRAVRPLTDSPAFRLLPADR